MVRPVSRSRLLYIRSSIALNTFGGLDDFHFNRRRKFDLNRFIVHMKDPVTLCFDEEILGIFDKACFEDDVLDVSGSIKW